MNNLITSPHNPLIKNILKLQQKAAERKRTGTFVAEGRREVSLAMRHGFKMEKLIFCSDLYEADPLYPIALKSSESDKVVEVTESVYRKLAYRESVEGVLLLGKSKFLSLKDYLPGPNPLILILEGVEKPGNLGAILRTTDAAAVEAIFLCNSRTDMYNPNAIRASLGCVFSQKIIECKSNEATNWLEEKKIQIFAASPGTPHLYYEADYSKPTAIAFGAEDKGLSPLWLDKSDRVIKIPMGGIIDSLNVSASVAIITFEAIRQRRRQA